MRTPCPLANTSWFQIWMNEFKIKRTKSDKGKEKDMQKGSCEKCTSLQGKECLILNASKLLVSLPTCFWRRIREQEKKIIILWYDSSCDIYLNMSCDDHSTVHTKITTIKSGIIYKSSQLVKCQRSVFIMVCCPHPKIKYL